MRQDAPEGRWQLDRHIPLSLLAAMLLQTIAFATWLSSNMSEIRSELRTASVRIEEIWRDRYTKEDARRDAALAQIRDDEHSRRIEDLERRIRAVEGRPKL